MEDYVDCVQFDKKFIKNTLKQIYLWKSSLIEISCLKDEYKEIQNDEDIYIFSCKLMHFVENIKAETDKVYNVYYHSFNRYINEVDSLMSTKKKTNTKQLAPNLEIDNKKKVQIKESRVSKHIESPKTPENKDEKEVDKSIDTTIKRIESNDQNKSNMSPTHTSNESTIVDSTIKNIKSGKRGKRNNANISSISTFKESATVDCTIKNIESSETTDFNSTTISPTSASNEGTTVGSTLKNIESSERTDLNTTNISPTSPSNEGTTVGSTLKNIETDSHCTNILPTSTSNEGTTVSSPTETESNKQNKSNFSSIVTSNEKIIDKKDKDYAKNSELDKENGIQHDSNGVELDQNNSNDSFVNKKHKTNKKGKDSVKDKCKSSDNFNSNQKQRLDNSLDDSVDRTSESAKDTLLEKDTNNLEKENIINNESNTKSENIVADSDTSDEEKEPIETDKETQQQDIETDCKDSKPESSTFKLKCIDINKLLDPETLTEFPVQPEQKENVVILLSSSSSDDNSKRAIKKKNDTKKISNNKGSKKVSCKKEKMVISESDDTKSLSQRRSTRNELRRSKRKTEIINISDSDTSEDESKSKSSSSSDEQPIRKKLRSTVRQPILDIKNKFMKLRKTRAQRFQHNKISSSDSSSDDDSRKTRKHRSLSKDATKSIDETSDSSEKLNKTEKNNDKTLDDSKDTKTNKSSHRDSGDSSSESSDSISSNDTKHSKNSSSTKKLNTAEKKNKKTPDSKDSKANKLSRNDSSDSSSESSDSKSTVAKHAKNSKSSEKLNTTEKKNKNTLQSKDSKANKSSRHDSGDSSSVSSDSKSSDVPKNTRNKLSDQTEIKFTIIKDIDWKKDVKFTSPCTVRLVRYTNEELVKNYLEELEEKDIERLTNMKSLKRTRQTRKNSSDSSTSSTSKITKKSRTVKKNNEKDSDSSNKEQIDSESEKEILPEINNEPPVKEYNLDYSADLFSSDDGMNNDQDCKINQDSDKDQKMNENSDKDHEKNEDSDKDHEKNEDSEKENNDDNKKEDKRTNEKMDTDDEQEEVKENGKEHEEDKDDKNGSLKESDNSDSDDDILKKKKKWRNNKLLKSKLDESDSEEEVIRFRSKKKEKEKETSEEEAKALKKTKKSRRKGRKLGSDSSSKSSGKSDEESEEKNSSSSETDQKKKKTRRRIKRIKDSEDSSDNGKSKDEKEIATRKKIRHVWNKDRLADTTKAAAKEEEERKKRISDRQKLYNKIYDVDLEHNAKVEKVVLDFNEETKEELLSVDQELVSKLKPHQATGVQFMWTACFESLERARKTEGSGCVLAHCMGLGKTLQVITLIHTLITNYEKTGIQTVLVVCPLSTVLNWVQEFKKWLDDVDGDQINVFELVTCKQPRDRLYQAKDWQKHGGVLIMGYDMFRNLTNPKAKRQSKKVTAGYNTCLVQPGPDLVICDEGHLLKNEKTGISIAMNRLRTQRRIVLTGTPLQNNLKEYYCMVQFVKPNLLGTYKEYLNRFVNPITNGQYTDSTDRDIAIMRRRSHVLHKMLDGLVQRKDYNVLAPFLPPKHEYVLFVTLTKIQVELYKEYLKRFARSSDSKGMSYLFQDFQELQRICIHPRVLQDKSKQDKLRRDKEDEDSEGSLKDFIDDGSEKSSSSNGSSSENEEGLSDTSSAKAPRRKTRANPGEVDSEPEVVEDVVHEEWWSKFCTGDELDNINHSSKILLLFEILHQCEMIGDKVLVFSQSLFSLNLIEYFLEKIDEATQRDEKSELLNGYQGSWQPGLDYFRLDGSTSCDKRSLWCKSFNSESNSRARLFLISTRAGGLGINLVAANRVIIFDVSWNPSHDIQSIYRVYRFGQTKPCYVYRFVTLGTMENKIYERQVTKQAISKRVIDEQQIDRHYNQNDLAELYAFTGEPTEERPIPMVPKDRLFADLLQTNDKNIYKYHEHNSLLENKEDETLNEEERKAAWEEFENEKKAVPKFDLMQTITNNGMYDALISLIQKDNPTANYTPIQLSQLVPSVINMINTQISQGDFRMYRRILEEKARLQEKRNMEIQYQKYIQQLGSGQANPSMLQQFFKNHPLQQFSNIPGPPPGHAASSSQLLNPFALNAPPKTTTEIVELDD